jgi:O-antigen ligase
MFPGITGWAISLSIIFVVWIVLYVRRGPSEALAPALLLSMAFPVWLKLTVFDVPFSVRTTTAAATMLAFAVHPRGRIWSPLTILDFCIGLLCCSQILTDTWHDGFSIALPFRAYGEWALPYVAGRYAIRNQQDLVTAAKWATGVLMFLSVLAVIETVTKINVAELVFGERPEELARRNMSRFNFKRAYATAMHPIYFGMILASLSPWLVCLLDKRESAASRAVAIFAVPVMLLGLLATISKTPIVTVLGSWFFLLAIIVRWLRIPVMTIVVASIVIFLIFPYQIADFFGKQSGDQNRIIEVDGTAVVYSSSRARLLLPLAYAKAMTNAGIVGYGSVATQTFPLKIPYMEGTAETRNMLRLVDNGYILTVLRMGWLGGFLLVLLLITGMISCWSLYRRRPDRLFPAAFLGFLIVYSLASLNLVSQVYDFFFTVVWTLGIISALLIQKNTLNPMSDFKPAFNAPYRKS